MPIPFALRVWNTGPDLCPPEIAEVTPEGYESGCVAVCIGGTHIDWADDVPGYLTMRMATLQDRLGFSDEAATTLCVRMAAAYLWTIFYDPRGLVTPAPAMPPPPQ